MMAEVALACGMNWLVDGLIPVLLDRGHCLQAEEEDGSLSSSVLHGFGDLSLGEDTSLSGSLCHLSKSSIWN